MDMTNVLYGGLPRRVEELEARLAEIAELARRIRESSDSGQMDADALAIQRLAEGRAEEGE